MNLNPYTPGAGTMPNYLAGRDIVISYAKKVLDYIAAGQALQPCIYYGLRGVGKTVLLNAIEELAQEKDFTYEHIEISENDDFRIVIAQRLRKMILEISKKEKAKDIFKQSLGILKAFTLTIENVGDFKFDVDAISGKADTGNFQNDLTELFLEIGSLAQKSDSRIALFIDEIQYMKLADFEALIGATHRVFQKRLPFTIFGAGLPKIIAMAADAKSYAERLFEFVEIGSLTTPNNRQALTEPALMYGVHYTDDALNSIIEITEGYPYFLQEYGSQVWDFQKNDEISIESVKSAQPHFFDKLDKSFFKARFDRATGNEKKFMCAMATLGKGPYETSLIAKLLEKKPSQIAIDRANLINKGFVYSTSHGYLDFTVPQFNDFLKRFNNL